MLTSRYLGCLFLLVFCGSAKSAEVITFSQKIVPPLASVFDRSGADVDVDGRFLVVGVPNDDVLFEDTGAAHLYENIGGEWQYLKKLTASPVEEDGLYGSAVSINGNYIAIGQPSSDFTNAGRVFIYSRNTGGNDNWGLVRVLSSPDANQSNFYNDDFGASIDMDTDTLIVGDPNPDDYRIGGAAYVFSKDGAGTVKKLYPYDGDSFDRFGASVTICDGRALVGSPQADAGQNRTDSGVVYSFTKSSSWGFSQLLNPLTTDSFDKFGYSVSCSGDFLAVGAPLKSGGSPNNFSFDGAVYIYTEGLNGWQLSRLIDAEDLPNSQHPNQYNYNDRFGTSVSLTGKFLIAGYGDRYVAASTENAARIFFFNDNSWKLKKTIRTSVAENCFGVFSDPGFSVSTDGRAFLVGDEFDESSANYCNSGTGSVRVYGLEEVEGGYIPAINLLLNDS